MNDRFKFRAWYKNNYIYDVEEATDNSEYLTGDKMDDFSSFADVVNREDCVVEQCTGLKDKNEKLIYENDYVTHKGNIYKVFWNKTKISLENILNNDIIDIQEFDCMEVIGNEHEKGNIRKI